MAEDIEFEGINLRTYKFGERYRIFPAEDLSEFLDPNRVFRMDWYGSNSVFTTGGWDKPRREELRNLNQGKVPVFEIPNIYDNQNVFLSLPTHPAFCELFTTLDLFNLIYTQIVFILRALSFKYLDYLSYHGVPYTERLSDQQECCNLYFLHYIINGLNGSPYISLETEEQIRKLRHLGIMPSKDEGLGRFHAKVLIMLKTLAKALNIDIGEFFFNNPRPNCEQDPVSYRNGRRLSIAQIALLLHYREIPIGSGRWWDKTAASFGYDSKTSGKQLSNDHCNIRDEWKRIDKGRTVKELYNRKRDIESIMCCLTEKGRILAEADVNVINEYIKDKTK